MPNLSHHQLIGHLGGDAILRQVGESQVLSFSVAYTRKRKGRDGEKTASTTWFRCEWWGSRGPKVAEYLTKGTPIMVIGELYEEEYEKDGQTRKSLKINVQDVVLLGSPAEKREPQPAQERIGRDGLRQNPPAASVDEEIPF